MKEETKAKNKRKLKQKCTPKQVKLFIRHFGHDIRDELIDYLKGHTIMVLKISLCQALELEVENQTHKNLVSWWPVTRGRWWVT